KYILNGEINIPDIILIIFICLLFRIVEDPIFRFKEIFYTKNEPNFISIKNNINLNTVLLFLNIVILGPFLEELVFRGLILNSFLKRNKSIGILISSVLFSLIHLSVTSFITSFFFGIVLSILFIRKGIIYSISLHVFYNLLWFVLKIFSQEYFQIEALLNFNITYWIIVIFSLSILVIYLTALYKKDYS
ncbi:MAG: CPBP family intramembrane metalloprotease, partial [Flavobacteriaceae bacterium]|nr:CPBP family intramembrane metalloprotease [Flavobacteriaceae bacterium]